MDDMLRHPEYADEIEAMRVRDKDEEDETGEVRGGAGGGLTGGEARGGQRAREGRGSSGQRRGGGAG